KSIPEIKYKLFWLSWNKLYKVLDSYPKAELPRNEQLLFSDLTDFLAHRNFTFFNGIHIKQVRMNWQYRAVINYSFNNINLKYYNWEYKNGK
ncbi:MAG: hypothetical protein JW982_09465, partial [Spirochaetes bacterium]|nr:hypothetical protein [Spirochaetota bacterium]